MRALLVVAAGLLGGPLSAHAAAESVQILQPAAGAVVNGGAVRVALTVTDAGLATDATRWPHSGLFYVALDGNELLQTPALQFVLMGIPPGPHRLTVSLHGYPDAPVAPAEVAFTAQAVAPPAGATWLMAGTVAAVGGVMLGALVLLWVMWVRPQRAEAIFDAPPVEPESGEGTKPRPGPF